MTDHVAERRNEERHLEEAERRKYALLQSATLLYVNHNNLQEAVTKAHQLLEAIELRQLNGPSKVPKA